LSFAPDTLYGVELTSLQVDSTTILLEGVDLWELDFRRASSGARETVVPSQMTWTSTSCSVTSSQLTVTWHDVTWPSSFATTVPLEVTMTASVDPTDADDAVSVRLSVTAPEASTDVSLYRMALNVGVHDINERDRSSQVLAVPILTGGLFYDPLNNCSLEGYNQLDSSFMPLREPDSESGKDLVVSHPGEYSMQWISYYDESEPDAGCFYWGTRDVGDLTLKPYNVRRLVSSGTSHGMALGAWHYPDDNLQSLSDRTFTLPFPVVMTCFEGDWYDSARYYRSWVESLSASEAWHAGRMEDNSNFSQTILDADMIGTPDPTRCQGSLGSGCSQCDPGVNNASWMYWSDDEAALKSELGVDDIVFRPRFWDYDAFGSYWGDWLDSSGHPHDQWEDEMGTLAEAVAPYFHPSVYSTGATTYSASGISGYSSVEPWIFRDKNQSTVGPAATGCSRGAVECPDAGCPIGMGVTNEPLCLATPFALDYMIHYASSLVSLGAAAMPSYGIGGLYLDLYHSGGRICYRTGHSSYHGEGNGDFWISAKRDNATALKAALRGAPWNVTEFFLMAEGVNECYLDSVEVTWDRSHTATGVGLCQTDRLAIAPLWTTVYNDYQVMGSTAPIKLPSTDDYTDEIIFAARMQYAANLFQGVEPYCSILLSDESVADQGTTEPLRYGEFLDMIKNFVSVVNHPDARDLVFFGERLRDPETNVDLTNPITSAFYKFFIPYQPEQPLTYAAAYGRPNDARLGFLFLNWSDAQDSNSWIATGTTPGQQSFKLLGVNLEEYGLAPGTYDVRVITAAGASSPISYTYGGGPVDLPSSVPAINFVMPSRTAELWIIE
jgi:hypothetical protein